MHTSENLFLQPDDTDEEEPLFASQTPSTLLRDFKQAIGLLLIACTIVTALMHWFVPGL